jgi:hypothetical protein
VWFWRRKGDFFGKKMRIGEEVVSEVRGNG